MHKISLMWAISEDLKGDDLDGDKRNGTDKWQYTKGT